MKNQKLRNFLSTLAFLLPLPAFAAAEALDTGIMEDEPLPPEQAFVLSTEILSADMIRAKWHIVDGYYMYRDKFKFESNTPGITADVGVYPKGKIKEDEFFGKVETYRGDIAIDIPLNRMGETQTLEMNITSQGCADIGICYPPQKQLVKFDLPALPKTAAAAEAGEDSSFSPISAIKKFGDSLLGEDEQQFLPVDKAFAFSAEVEDGNTIKARWAIEDGYYLYRDKFSFALQDANGVELGKINMPEGKEKVDESFGRMIVYFKNVDLNLPLKRTQLDPTEITLVAKYQGCAEAGLCYPPQTKTMPLSLPAGQAMPTAAMADGASASESPATEGDEEKRSFIGNLLFAFGIGLLLSFTPCVLPMIPILVGVIVGQSGQQPTKMRAGMLSTSYVFGTALVYSVAGWLAGASGQQLQAYTQNVWGIGIVAVILVLLALSMFGFYEIQMPSAIQSRLQMKSQNVKGGSMFGTFFLGTVSALIVGACVTPLLMLVLGIAIQSGDPVLGASMMFAMAWGMGVVLITVGVGAGHLLPKAGGWMDIIKYVFGVLLIGVAIYLMTPLQEVPILLVWGTFFIVVGVYMGATQAVPEGASKWRYMWKGLGTVLLIWGVLAIIGGMQGNRDIMQPVDTASFGMAGGGGQGMVTQSALVEPHDLFIHLKNTAQLDDELARAKAAGKPVMLDYFATWCTDCRRMEKATFNNPQVQKFMQEKFVSLQVDVTDPNNADTEAIKKRFKVFGPPAMLFFDKDGKPRKDLNFYGFKGPEEFIATLDQI
jgi:thiol:disulfide interchange protein DsbD